MWRAVKTASVQHVSPGGWCEQKDGNSKGKTKETLEIKNGVTEMKNAFDDLISRLDTNQERICESENSSTETSQVQKIKRNRKENFNKGLE